MTGYIRQDVGNNIENDEIADATYLDQEYDAIQAAFNASTGHAHAGGVGEGAPITVIGPVQNYVATTEVFRPKITDTYDLGTNTLRFRDLYLSGVVNAPSLSGRFLADDGTAALPSYSFQSDEDTGIYREAANTLGFATNGVSHMTIGPAGTVAIGGALTVGSNLTVTGNITGNINASQINSGNINSDRVNGSYPNITGVGALNSGSIGPGFGGINIGASNLSAGNGTFAGNVTAAGSVVAAQNFVSTTTNAILTASGTGGIYLRPQGVGSSAGQLAVSNNGNTTIAGTLTVSGDYSGPVSSSNLTGTIDSGRLTGSYTGITAIGSLTTMTVGGWSFSSNDAFSSNGDASFLRMAGGGTANTGAKVITFGPSHSSNANEAVVDGSTVRIRSESGSNYLILSGSGLAVGSNLGISFAGTGAATTRTNLGLGSIATRDEGIAVNQVRNNGQNNVTFLQISNNLSDLGNTTTARSNLGLGTLATQNEGTGGGDFRDNSANEALFYRKSIDTIAVADLPTTSGSEAWVRGRIADGTEGSIGTYAMLRNDGGGNIAWGDVVAGSGLDHAHTTGTDNVAVTGQWKCMGYCPTNTVSLFMRVS